MSRRLLIVVNDATFFLSHRLPIALEAKSQGYDVHIATGVSNATKDIVALGLVHHELPLTRSGKNIFYELYCILFLYKLMMRLRPDIVHLVTIKPVLYGGIAARLARVYGVVAAISGLGSVFVGSGIRKQVIRFFVLGVYRLALGKENLRVIFQNPYDVNVLLRFNVVQKDKVRLISGSGIDLAEYIPTPEPQTKINVVMAARLLREKGVIEFIEAAKILKSQGLDFRFCLVGAPDPGNPSSITAEELDQWKNEKYVEVLGFKRSVLRIFQDSHIVVLPSFYGEGLPKVLIEAAACARAVITTDNPGCRDAILPDITGVLIPVKDSFALANAIRKLAEDESTRLSMGREGRLLAEREFSIAKVVASHLTIYSEVAPKK